VQPGQEEISQVHATPLAPKAIPPTNQATVAESPSVPNCPACNAAMVKRQAKKGPNTGGWFWACTAYPKCRKVLAVEAG
jgi:ssDNA-binding Zn-finger/Zn-ribbon topoisomerase 1